MKNRKNEKLTSYYRLDYRTSLRSLAMTRGFILTEVIVVIVIIAALAIISIPNMLSLMPDDHKIKYKKAFYTIQEIVNDIASECQGMEYDYTNNVWKEPSNQYKDNILNFCYDTSSVTPTIKEPGEEICKRLSTTEGTDCTTIIQTGSLGNYY